MKNYLKIVLDNIDQYLQKELDVLTHTKEKDLLEKRYQKFRKIGVMS